MGALSDFHKALDATALVKRNEGDKPAKRVSDALTRMADQFLSINASEVSDLDLLAVLLAGSTTVSPRKAAEKALSISEHDLSRIIRAEQMRSFSEFTTVSVARVVAAGELSRRAGFRAQVSGVGEPITGAVAAARVFRKMIGGPVERLAAIYTDGQLRVMGMRILSVGSARATVLSPAEILRPAIEMRASGFFLAHNHPSGKVEPSQADISSTRTLQAAAKYVEMSLFDHIIIGAGNSYYSFAEEGMLGTL